MQKYLICVVLGVISIAFVGNALKCYECSGSEMSDCAKGVKTAGVEVTCEAPQDISAYGGAAGNEEATTEQDATTTESVEERQRRLGCFQPLKLYPACVTYSMKPYNGVEGQMMVYRSCMLSPDNFCKSHLQYNKDTECRSCNSTDFCM